MKLPRLQNVHTHIPTYIHTYIHAYIHTYIHCYEMSYPKSFVKVCLTHSQIIRIFDFSWDSPHIVMNVMHCIHAFRNTESTLKGSQWWAESLKKTTTSNVFVFPRSEFGVTLVLPVTEYRAMTFVDTSHAFVKFWTFIALPPSQDQPWTELLYREQVYGD